MFESDDFDQVLSQFEFPDEVTNSSNEPIKVLQTETRKHVQSCNSTAKQTLLSTNEMMKSSPPAPYTLKQIDNMISPKHTKRKIISSYFDQKTKRKFPGPAGLLTGAFEEPKDDNICQIELLSQDLDFTQNHLQRQIFESPLWMRLLDDLKSWNLQDIDSIKTIKYQTSGNLKRLKAKIVIAFIETIDRSVTDPLIILRDTSGNIKCTLHRDAWSTFSPYIVSEYCALVLCKPTVLTTGSAFKKHYLNITLSNILAVYCSNVFKDESYIVPDGYSLAYEEDFTIIRSDNVHSIGTICNNLPDDLDTIFSDETF